ncbi:hypothetical protein H0H93_010300 [Arthromyces matolae]|nr:hypothetical protein H0H93_010300 [Arthromyces matolae]
MPNPMLNARAGGGVGLGRNHNYQAIYEPDPKGEELADNARIWKVYLDEADAYDADMIDSFRMILDNLLVFASLFSAVVTTFVSQTSQVLQPDNAQITVSLLMETNQLLRAAGNSTKIDSVAPSSLGPDSTMYTSTDLWVNGLFFTSLTLSVTTALLTVLAKQWIQAYIEVVSGSAKTQAMIRQFRYDGLVRWKLGAIIEGLPLILHSSVALFLVGLSLYVSQLSRSICAILSLITAMTFIFYLGTSMIPAFSVDCPYRLSSMFFLGRFLNFIALYVRHVFCVVVGTLFKSLHDWKYVYYRSRLPVFDSLKDDESLYVRERPVGSSFKCFSWLFAQSTNTSTKDIVVEGASVLLDHANGLTSDEHFTLYQPEAASLLLDALVYCVNCQTAQNSGTNFQSLWDTFISTMFATEPELLPSPRYEKQSVYLDYLTFVIGVWKLYASACREKNQRARVYFLGIMRVFGMENTIRDYLLMKGNQDDMRCAMDTDTEFLFLRPDNTFGETMLHTAVIQNNLDAVIVLLEVHPELINMLTKPLPFQQTALDYALSMQRNEMAFNPQIVECLLDHGALRPYQALHITARDGNIDCIRVLLDRGFDRTARNGLGETPLDLAHTPEIIEYLECYQTVPLPHPHLLLPPEPTSDTAESQEDVQLAGSEIPLDGIPLARDASIEGKAGVQWENDYVDKY